jgi:hypothetical protein
MPPLTMEMVAERIRTLGITIKSFYEDGKYARILIDRPSELYDIGYKDGRFFISDLQKGSGLSYCYVKFANLYDAFNRLLFKLSLWTDGRRSYQLELAPVTFAIRIRGEASHSFFPYFYHDNAFIGLMGECAAGDHTAYPMLMDYIKDLEP